MPSPCSICAHDQQREIDAALRDGLSLRVVAERFHVSSSTLGLHSQHREDAPVPEASPLLPLCPPWDEEEQAHTREQLHQALADTQHTVHAALRAIDQQADALAKILALRHVQAFTPFRTDDDLSRTEEYKAFMGRPKRAEAALEQAVATWRVALRTLEQARNALTEHDHARGRAHRQQSYLQTEQGQALAAQWDQLHEALSAATTSNNRRLVQVIAADIERVQRQFLLWAHSFQEAA